MRTSLFPRAFLLSLVLGTAHASDILAPGATLEKVASGFNFTEGPAADSKGNVYFTDQPNDRILIWTLDNQLETFMTPCGRANGLYFDRNDHLWACADEKNQLWKIDPDKNVTILLDKVNGKLFNGPNDLWISPKGHVYFTDPYYKRAYWEREQDKLEVQGVYLFLPDLEELHPVIEDLLQPNGIIGTPDNKILYVSDIRDGKTYAYAIQEDGTLQDKRLFCEMGSDGMTLDEEGNVYLTNKEGVTVFNQHGERIENIPTGASWTANVCFGGADGKTLFITAMDGLYAISMNIRGARSQ